MTSNPNPISLSEEKALDIGIASREYLNYTPTPDASYQSSLHKDSDHGDGDRRSLQHASNVPEDQEQETETNKKKQDGQLSRVSTEEEGYITGIKLMLVMTSVCLVVFLMLLDVTIISTAIPRITSDFHSLEDVGWYGSAYLLTSASMQPLAGKIYTYFPTKRTFLSFFFIFELGSLLCGVAQSSKMLIIARAVGGMGTAGIINGALTIISTCVPLHKRPVYTGTMLGIAQIGTVVGPLIGGIFTEYVTWRWCFYINLPVGGLAAILLFLIQVPDNAQILQASVINTILTKLDLIGFALFAPASIQIFLALQYGGNQFAWNSPAVIGLFCGSGGTFIIFLLWQYYKGDEAMIPLSIARKQTVWASCVYVFFFSGTVQLLSYYLPIYFQAVKGASPTMSGVYMLPSIISQLIAVVGSGAAVSKLGYYTPWAIACGILTSVGYGLFSTFSPSTTTGQWIGYQIFVGFGRGIGMQMGIVAVQNSLPPKLISISMSLLTFSQVFGGSMFQAFADTAFTNSLPTYLAMYAQGVNPQSVIEAGATGVASLLLGPAELTGVLMAYSKSVDRVFYLAVGCSCACFLFAWGMGWKDTRKKPKKAATSEKIDKVQATETDISV